MRQLSVSQNGAVEPAGIPARNSLTYPNAIVNRTSLSRFFDQFASGYMFLMKAVQSFDRFADKRRAVEVVHSIENRLGYCQVVRSL